MKASKFFIPLIVGLLIGQFLTQPGYAVTAVGVGGGGTTLTDSASLRAALSDENGTGAALFSGATSPTFVTPILGTPTSGTLTNCTGLPPAGVTGTAAILGANTFTTLQTVTQANANTGILASTGYSLTGSNATNMIDLGGTWNTSGTPTALKLNITNTASNASSLLADFQYSGTSAFKVHAGYQAVTIGGCQIRDYGSGQISIGANTYLAANIFHLGTLQLGFGSSVGTSGSDVLLTRDAANTLALRSTTNAQAFGVYNTYTSSTSQEKYQTAWSSNVCYTGTKAGSSAGSNRLEVHHGGEEKALTESSATEVVQISISSGVTAASITGGMLHYTIIAGDGTELQSRSGSVHFSAVNKSGTETVGLGTVINESVAASTGTLTCTWDTDTAATNAVTFRCNAVSSLSQSFLTCRYRLELFGPQMTAVPVP